MSDHDDLLDAALVDFRADVQEMTDTAFTTGRARLRTTIDAPAVRAPATAEAPVIPMTKSRRLLRSPPGRRRRLVAAAAVVTAVAAGALVLQTVQFGDNAPVASAATELNTAADNIHAQDEPVGEGQYRYVAIHSWSIANVIEVSDPPGLQLSWRQENLDETWIPRDQNEEWLNRQTVTGNYEWIDGDDEKAAQVGVDLPKHEVTDMRAACGDYAMKDADNAEPYAPCTAPAGWGNPTPEFIADLPTDPQRMYELLRKNAEGKRDHPDQSIMEDVSGLLSSGVVPAEVRATLYRALALIPNLEIVDGAVNLDGRKGTAYGVTRAGLQQEIVIDPSTGEFIGEREVTTEDSGPIVGTDPDGTEHPIGEGTPAGTVWSYSAVSTAVVDEIGVQPAG